ncbi:MAG: ZIP family metal transporter [Planctomycetota bacterium]
MLVPALVFLAALVGGAASWLASWNERRLHVALALSTGTFLGAVFLHLLPDVAGRAAATAHHGDVHAQTVAVEAPADHDHDHDHEGAEHAEAEPSIGSPHGHGDPTLWLCVLAGVLLVHTVEAVFLRTTEREEVSRHQSVGLMTLVGVSVHAASAGLGLSALEAGQSLETSFVVAFLTHKAFESFAMVNVFQLAHLPRARTVVVLALFALVTPACMLAGTPLLAEAGAATLDVVTALAAGTFLYVCVAELLPEVFHHPGDNLAKFTFLLAGVILSAVLVEFGA